jgi:hypothetical protein
MNVRIRAAMHRRPLRRPEQDEREPASMSALLRRDRERRYGLIDQDQPSASEPSEIDEPQPEPTADINTELRAAARAKRDEDEQSETQPEAKSEAQLEPSSDIGAQLKLPLRQSVMAEVDHE